MKSRKNSRRYFLKTAGSLIGVACLGLWGSMVNNQQNNTRKKTISISLNDYRAVLFHDDYIIVNKEYPLVLSSYCTHLGCKIQTYENGVLICPCHGSSFDLDGNPLKGPAIKPLKKFEYSTNMETKTLTIKT